MLLVIVFTFKASTSARVQTLSTSITSEYTCLEQFHYQFQTLRRLHATGRTVGALSERLFPRISPRQLRPARAAQRTGTARQPAADPAQVYQAAVSAEETGPGRKCISGMGKLVCLKIFANQRRMACIGSILPTSNLLRAVRDDLMHRNDLN